MRIKMSSILFIVSFEASSDWSDVSSAIPLFNGHQNPLDDEAFENLRPDALEKPAETFMVDNELHHIDKTRKWLPVSFPRWLGLQTDLCDNKRLRGNCGQCLGNGAENYSGLSKSCHVSLRQVGFGAYGMTPMASWMSGRERKYPSAFRRRHK
jgi:hypothetical protein